MLALKSSAINTLAKTLAASSSINDELTFLASLLTSKASAISVASTFDVLYGVEKLLKKIMEAGKATIVTRLLESGIEVGDSGTRTLDVDGKYTLEIRRTGAVMPDKTLEGLLRAKGIDPATVMDVCVTYKTNHAKLTKAVVSGLISTEEIESIKPEQRWAVQRPQRIE